MTPKVRGSGLYCSANLILACFVIYTLRVSGDQESSLQVVNVLGDAASKADERIKALQELLKTYFLVGCPSLPEQMIAMSLSFTSFF